MGKKLSPFNLLALPNPNKWEPDGRSFEHSAPGCKICGSKYRELIENLIMAGTTGKNTVKWANHYRLFAPRQLNEMNVSKHKGKHMRQDEMELSAPDSLDDRQALKELLAMVDEDKLDLVAARGLIRVLKGTRKPSVRESIMAIKVKNALPRELAEAERARLLVERWKKKEQEEEAQIIESTTVEGETIEDPEDMGIEDKQIGEDLESGSEWYQKR